MLCELLLGAKKVRLLARLVLNDWHWCSVAPFFTNIDCCIDWESLVLHTVDFRIRFAIS